MPAMQCMQPAQRRVIRNFLLGLLCALLLAACGSVPSKPAATDAAAPRPSVSGPIATTVPSLPPAGSGRGGYYQDDGPGDLVPEGLHALPDAEPRIEPYGKRGNRPYVVFGKSYTPFLHDRPFKQRGRGSWYGKKFHGQRTSSGEIYDMYKMSAAHPTMPLPSYARVTNLANGRQVIVRVNDRGPFHSSRIIDLSYTAALKLGYLKQGSAELEVERLLPDEIAHMTANRAAQSSPSQPELLATGQTVAERSQGQPAVSVFAVPVAAAVAESAAAAPLASGFYLQLGAYSQAASAEAASRRLQPAWAGSLPPLEIIPQGGLFRLFSGPFANRAEAAAAAQKILDAGAAKPMVVQR